jgi:succinoglycan biosynthesis protein ExoV
MKLYYHNDFNFGDALNPFLFEKLLPDFFDEDDSETLLGFGSILSSYYKPKPATKKIIVFTSGFAYGNVPSWRSDIEVEYLAVRGPLTAEAMGIPKEKGIVDGGILSYLLLEDQPAPIKKYKYAFIPHHESVDKYADHKRLCEQVGVHFIDPNIRKGHDAFDILREIQSTEILIAEALHGAIIAEALRVPFIPVKCYKHINEFKWQDFAQSLDLKINLHPLQRLYSRDYFVKRTASKLSLPNSLSGVTGTAHSVLVKTPLLSEKRFVRRMQQLMKESPVVQSKESVFRRRKEQLFEIVENLKQRTPQVVQHS